MTAAQSREDYGGSRISRERKVHVVTCDVMVLLHSHLPPSNVNASHLKMANRKIFQYTASGHLLTGQSVETRSEWRRSEALVSLRLPHVWLRGHCPPQPRRRSSCHQKTRLHHCTPNTNMAALLSYEPWDAHLTRPAPRVNRPLTSLVGGRLRTNNNNNSAFETGGRAVSCM